MYKGLKVLGKQLIVSTDGNGVITSLSGNFDPLYDIDVNPVISCEAAAECAAGVTGAEPENTELMVYRIETGYDAPVWYCSYGSRFAIINALDGGIVSDGSTDLEITEIYGEGEALRDSSYSGRVYVDNVDGTIYAQDNIRNMALREAEIYSEEYKTGFFSYGISVVDFTTGAYVNKAKITIKNTGSNEVTSLKTDFNGKAHFDITMNRYIVNIEAKGYISDTFYIDVADEPANSIVIELIPKSYAGKENNISGTIIDVSTGKCVEGAAVRIRQGQDKKYGPVTREYCCVTDENGIYSFYGLETGYYTVEVEKYGYVTEYLSTWSVPSEALEDEVPGTVNYNICIYPGIYGSEYRVVLEWNLNPQDLDSHIICGENGIERYHVYYGSKKSTLNDGSVVQLDVDDMNGYGPETVSFTINDDYCYRYYVHWFGGSGTWDTSGAKVTVFCGNRRIRTYSVGKSGYISDRSWNVFSIENGRIVEAER